MEPRRDSGPASTTVPSTTVSASGDSTRPAFASVSPSSRFGARARNDESARVFTRGLSVRNYDGRGLPRGEVSQAQEQPHEKGDCDQQVTPIAGTTGTHPEQIGQENTEGEQRDEPLGRRRHCDSLAVAGILPQLPHRCSDSDVVRRRSQERRQEDPSSPRWRGKTSIQKDRRPTALQMRRVPPS